MSKPQRIACWLAIASMMSLSGCATPTQRSAILADHSPLPSPVDNFQVVTPDALYRSGQPTGDADWDYLKAIGITTVIKLNQYAADTDAAEELRMAKRRNIEVLPLYLQPEDLPHNWNPWAGPDSKTLTEVIRTLENRGHRKILVHCSHGKDRTGLVVALYRIRNQQLCKEAAYQEMKHYGSSPFLFGLKPVLDAPEVKESAGCRTQF